MKRGHADSAAASRRHPRARVELDVELATGDDGEEPIRGRCVELSAGGMRVVTEDGSAWGNDVSVHLSADGSPLDLAARVVWSARGRGDERLLGLAFEDAGAEAPWQQHVGELVALRSWGRSSRL